MRIIGIEIQASDVVAVVVDGTRTNVVIERIEPTRISFPQVGSDEAENLLLFENQLTTVISQARVECVGIIRAIEGKYSSSPIKVKIECLVQLAARRNKVRCDLISPQKVATSQRVTPRDGENVKRAIETLEPKYAQKAAYCAWSVLRANT
jgi:hypothetical protein